MALGVYHFPLPTSPGGDYNWASSGRDRLILPFYHPFLFYAHSLSLTPQPAGQLATVTFFIYSLHQLW